MTITLLTSSIAPPNNAGFFDLQSNESIPDDVELTPGLLAGYAGGIRALDGDDTVTGSSDGEIVNGNSGKDILYGKDGNDFFLGGRDEDAVYGDNGSDSVNGNRGNDLVDGGIGNDQVRGGQDNDLLIGAQGNDTLIGDFGQDVLIGGIDSDVFVLRTDAPAETLKAADIIADFDKVSDRIGLTSGVSEASLSFEPFVASAENELRESLKNSNFSENEINFYAPILLRYIQSLPNDSSPLTSIIEPLFKDKEVDNQQVQAIFQSYIRYSDIDPNGDGLIEGTAIKYNNTFLGVALNASASDLSGHFTAF